MTALAGKALSELRLISGRDHERGMERTEAARRRGEKWLSRTTVLEWTAALDV